MNTKEDIYIPTENEPFMNGSHKEFFKRKLLEWKRHLLNGGEGTLQEMQGYNCLEPDAIDMACNEVNHSIQLKTRDRERKLINKIDEALRKIQEGSYGYCEETGDPISLKRLIARPIATLSLEAQERHEKKERVYKGE